MGFFLVGWGAYSCLSWRQGSNPLVNQLPWDVWKVAAAIGIAMAVIVGAHGVATLVRVVKDQGYEINAWSAGGYCAAALVL